MVRFVVGNTIKSHCFRALYWIFMNILFSLSWEHTTYAPNIECTTTEISAKSNKKSFVFLGKRKEYSLIQQKQVKTYNKTKSK